MNTGIVPIGSITAKKKMKSAINESMSICMLAIDNHIRTKVLKRKRTEK